MKLLCALTMGMLLSIHLLVQSSAKAVQMDAKAATQVQIVSRAPRGPQG